jgi:TonB family protein
VPIVPLPFHQTRSIFMLMRLPILVLVVLAVAQPARAAAQRTWSNLAGDTLPASATVVDLGNLVVQPTLVNRSTIEHLLSQNYPPALREAGMTGKATVTMVVDPTGVPRLVTVSGSSGMIEFDEASVRVVRGMRFTEPVLNGAPVWVRVRVPVEFALQP